MSEIQGIPKTARLAIFDVDETILSIKGLFSFAEFFFCMRRGANGLADGQPFSTWMESLRRIGSTMSREYVNRQFYAAFTGYEVSLVERCAHEWFDRLLQSDQMIFIESTLAAVQAHREREIPVVLLSGSARLFLAPLATLIDATYVLSIELQVDAVGRLTGQILPPQTIGDGKWLALSSLLEDLSMRAEECIGYGDHVSDLPFLMQLGQAAVVAGDKTLESIAVERGWSILPRTPVALPVAWMENRYP